MIMEEMGKLCDAVALADSGGYIGYCLNLANAIGYPGNAQNIWVAIRTNVAASFGDSNETYEIQLHCGSSTDDTDLNGDDDPDVGTLKRLLSTTALDGNDPRLSTAGKYVLRCTLPYEANMKYLQFWYAKAGTTNTWTIDASILPAPPPSDDYIQVTESPVGVP